jgi:lauroyl/myristoyl acyltransferase
MTTKQGRNTIFQRSLPTRLMYALGKVTPPSLAGGVVWVITQILLAWKPANYYGALGNLAHVMPPETTETERVRAVRRLFYYSALSYYHLFHIAGKGDLRPGTFEPRVEMSAEARGYVQEAVATGRGLMVLGSHSSNFDLCGIAFSHCSPLPVQANHTTDASRRNSASQRRWSRAYWCRSARA